MKKKKIFTILGGVGLSIVLIILFMQAIVIGEGILLGKREWKIREKNKQENVKVIEKVNTEEQSFINEYKKIEYLDITYTGQNTKISDYEIGRKLDTVTKNKEIELNIFSINNYSEECVIAVQFSDTLEYYVYVNTRYRAETIGDLINNYNLRETLSFKDIYYSYDYIDLKLNKRTEKIEFYDIDSEHIWEMLFDDMNLKILAMSQKHIFKNICLKV